MKTEDGTPPIEMMVGRAMEADDILHHCQGSPFGG